MVGAKGWFWPVQNKRARSMFFHAAGPVVKACLTSGHLLIWCAQPVSSAVGAAQAAAPVAREVAVVPVVEPWMSGVSGISGPECCLPP